MLYKDIQCTKCSNVDLKLVKRKRNKEGNKIYSWQCENKKCQSYCSVKKDSFFELHNKKRLDLIIQLKRFGVCVFSLYKHKKMTSAIKLQVFL